MITGDERYLLTDAKIHYIFHIQILSLQKSLKPLLFNQKKHKKAILQHAAGKLYRKQQRPRNQGVRGSWIQRNRPY